MKTLSSFAEDVFENRWRNMPSEEAMLSMSRTMLKYVDGGKMLEDIKIDDLDKIKRGMRSDGYSDGYINNILGHIRVILNDAVEYGKIQAAVRVRPVRVREGRARNIAGAHIPLLLAAADARVSAAGTTSRHRLYESVRDAIVLALNTGLRRGEIARIRANDYMAIEQRLKVYCSKSDTGRDLPINDAANEIIRSRVAVSTRGSDMLFPADGACMQYNFRVIVEEAGLYDENYTFHSLRHTFCTNAISNNIPLPIVKQLARHSDISVTMKYVHILSSDLENEIGKLPSYRKAS